MDEVDRQIIAHLRGNGRASYGEIGELVGLSPSAAKRRVDHLVDNGVILGFTVAVDAFGPMRPTEAYVEVFCTGTVAPDELMKIIAEVPEVVHAGTVTGAADAMVHMIAADIASLEMAIEKIREAPHVDHTETSIVLTPLTRRGTCAPGLV